MRQVALIWNGTPDEFLLLRKIVDANCPGKPCGWPGHPRCPSHTLLVDTQRGLDDLLFMQRIRGRLLAEENHP